MLSMVGRTREARARLAHREAERAILSRSARLDAAERAVAASTEDARQNSSASLRWARVFRGILLAAYRARTRVSCSDIARRVQWSHYCVCAIRSATLGFSQRRCNRKHAELPTRLRDCRLRLRERQHAAPMTPHASSEAFERAKRASHVVQLSLRAHMFGRVLGVHLSPLHSGES